LPSPLPRVGITLGDPAGIGPEIAVRILSDRAVREACVPVLVGAREVVAREVEQHAPGARVVETTLQDDVRAGEGDVLLLPTGTPDDLVPYGTVHPGGGRAAVEAVRAAVEATLAGRLDAICTAPLNKESMRGAGFHYDGHTEMLAEFTGCRSVSMLLMGDRLRVAHVSTHTALAGVPAKMTPERLTAVVRIADEALRRIGIGAPRIAVAGLNPHSGENGLFGTEEQTVMVPTLAALAAEGFDVRGPVSPDAVFLEMMDGRYDLVVVAYHDQGHIPVKLIERDVAVNVTGGLPIIRTSVDHGTAFDIAGKGVASTVNMGSALLLAARMATRR
jgi:4-phospho-D-threonate 3-dehydrogenase / 4-phospho-D-erythronate 3-dehydrogenase